MLPLLYRGILIAAGEKKEGGRRRGNWLVYHDGLPVIEAVAI